MACGGHLAASLQDLAYPSYLVEPLKYERDIVREPIIVSNGQITIPTSPDPWWATAVEDFRHANPEELPTNYADGYLFKVPVIDTSIYLDYLVRTFQVRKGQIVQRAIMNLSEAFTQSDIVVNCTGLGARELVGDYDLRPAKGQIVRIKHNGFSQVVRDHREEQQNSLTHITPRIHDIVLGGIYEENNESLEVDPEQTQDIMRV